MEHDSPAHTMEAPKKYAVEEVEDANGGKEPDGFNSWAAHRLVLPDDGRFEFDISESSLRSKYSSNKSEAESVTQRVNDFMAYQMDVNQKTPPFICQDVYESVDGRRYKESIEWYWGEVVKKTDTAPKDLVKNGVTDRGHKICQSRITGLDFARNAHEIFKFNTHFNAWNEVPSSFGTQTRPSYNSLKFSRVGRGGYQEEMFFVAIWYTCGVGEVPYSVLGHGPLYGSPNAQLVQKRIEIFLRVNAPSRGWHAEDQDGSVKPSREYEKHCRSQQEWTMIVSTPPTMTRYRRIGFDLEPMPYNRDYGCALFNVVRGLLEVSLDEWTAVLDHIEGLLAEGHSICSPQDHDRLLVDDENLTRSRKYFWIMTCIDEFSFLVDRTTQALDEMYRGSMPPEEEGIEEAPGGVLEPNDPKFMGILRKQLVRRYEAFSRRLEDQRRRTELFRNGVQLFNASSVMESRLSSRLSENVMLLTYVSIFYIPLAFITSLWAVPNTQLSANHLAYAMATVGVVTYFVTFNISTISRAWRRVYQRRRNRIVEKMKVGRTGHGAETQASPAIYWNSVPAAPDPVYWTSEPAVPKPNSTGVGGELKENSDKWKVRGERYENVFHVSRDKSEPSEWYIALFPIYRVSTRALMWAATKLPPGDFWQKLLGRAEPQAMDEGNAVEKGKSNSSEGKAVTS
ncbi:hypothetical protein CONLIGDRAFT_703951 [Coniochaeta ligniaria NRRL 30616]|uniref:Cora-domain-containing protein n=1 Tax=Coniochaeta ligniaria NRRL 30616 TaxID=1408157 RepID=A0A1J7INK9_9PEZI|nr:hypothetical protein CONLIGDRAFT_703951 [Coniochaeta ligniaria NRRL 30616]